MKRIFQITCWMVFTNYCAWAQPPGFNRIMENNGLKGNLFVHDPVMIKQGDTYYIFFYRHGH